MITLADIIREYGQDYETQYADKILPSHRRTLNDIAHCHTAVMGGHLYYCESCDQHHYQYHSCQNRHCPHCQHRNGQEWLEKQQDLLLPVPYFMVTFTLPSELQTLAYRHQKIIYNILFRTAAQALQELAWDPRYVGAQIGMLGVLHTWGRDLSYHPHVHFLVPAGGLSIDGEQWVAAKRNFLVPVKALSLLFRAKFRDALCAEALLDEVPLDIWHKGWVTHAQPVGNGESALGYLAPYIFRIAISNRRILSVEDGKVTFSYRASDTGRWRKMTVSAHEFLRRFLQHVLPKGFVKVRYYGLFSPAKRYLIFLIQLWLQSSSPQCKQHMVAATRNQETGIACPACGQPLRWICKIRPQSRHPPMAG